MATELNDFLRFINRIEIDSSCSLLYGYSYGCNGILIDRKNYIIQYNVVSLLGTYNIKENQKTRFFVYN